MTSSSSLDRTLILSVTLPDGSRQEVFLQRGLTIGRTDANTVCIDHPDVERIHARVSSQPDGTMTLECQTDKSGLLVDGDSEPKFRLPLTPGTQFRIGPAQLECTLWQTPTKERWAANPWRVRCPRCHASLAEEPRSAKACPQCSLAIVHFNPSTDSEQQDLGSFRGWLPSQVGPYAIRSFVAEGGMGIVLRGLHTKKDKFAAVKLLQLSDDPQAEARFTEEVANVAKCVHPNIVRLQESGHDGRLVWLALDWVDGKPLETYIAKAKASDKAISIEKISDWMTQIVKGLTYLHQKEIIHRDLKPGNILVARDGLVKITDFSIAKDPKSGATSMTRTGAVAGSAGYMSPEQQEGRRVGLETDIFSLGVVWYEMLMLRRPVGTYQSIRTKRENCPPEWDDLIARCLHFDSKSRPTANDLVKTLATSPASNKQHFIFEPAISEKPRGTGTASTSRNNVEAAIAPSTPNIVLPSRNRSGFRAKLKKIFGINVGGALISLVLVRGCIHLLSEAVRKNEEQGVKKSVDDALREKAMEQAVKEAVRKVHLPKCPGGEAK
jgi:serine/threonine protein kinase